MKILVILAFIGVGLLALKPSEAGVNDWHLSNIGEVREITFNKNKIQFLSNLNQIGIIDKFSGKIDARHVIPETQKVVSWGRNEVTVATRHNQVITYFFKPSGVDKVVNDQFIKESEKIDSYTKVNKLEYFMTNSTFYQKNRVIKKVNEGSQFLKIVGGVKEDQSEIVFLVYESTDNKICIQNYHNNSFQNIYCLEQSSSNIVQAFVVDGYLIIEVNHSTYILAANLELIQEIDQKIIQIVNNVVTFETRSYSLKLRENVNKRPIKSSRDDVQITLTENQNSVIIFRGDIQLVRLAHNNSEVRILRAWFNHKSQLQHDIVIQYTDLQLVSYAVSRGSSLISWKKQQSLGYIDDVIFMKYNQLDTLDNPYHRKLISHSYRSMSLIQKISNVPSDLIFRLTEEITDIIRNAYEIFFYAIDHIGSIDSNTIRKFSMSKQQQITYGLRKYLIAVTRLNTIIAIDTKTKQILWKINHNNLDSQFVGIFQLKRDYQTENAILITFSKKSSTIIIEEISENGSIQRLHTYPSNQVPSVYKLNDHSIALKIGDKIEKYGLFQQDDLVQKQYYFYTCEERQINGWKVIGHNIVNIWNFQTNSPEKILKIASAFRGDQRSHIPLFDREKVFFKNVDFTNIAVLTNTNYTNIGLYIINGRTGKVQYNSYKNNINNGLPVNLVYDENNVLVSYYHIKNKMFEIWTIEQYQERIQSSAINMIGDYLNEVKYQPQENREQTIFSTEVYGSPVAIKEMYVSESKMSLTRRNIFIITRENKLFTINRDFVNTRRPRKDSKQSQGFFSNQKLPQYTYLLPFNPTFYLSYDLPLGQVSNIRFSPTDMESSIFVFCYGVDNFLIRTAPDKTFDMITEDFNYVLLILILLAGTAGILFFKRLVTISKLKKPHLQ